MTGNTAETKEIVIRVGGMMCMHCVKRMEGALGRLPGFVRATANLEKQQVTVVFDPTRVSHEDMKKAVEGAGYRFLGVPGEE